MDYKFTFEDGSESLMHHGVKGMKWGVWNAETAARYNETHFNSPTQRQVDKATMRRDEARKNLDGSEKARRKYEKADKHYWRTVSGKNAAIISTIAGATAVAAGIVALRATGFTAYGLSSLHEMIDPDYVKQVAEKYGCSESLVRKKVIEVSKRTIDGTAKSAGVALVSGLVSAEGFKTEMKYSGRNKAHKMEPTAKTEPNDTETRKFSKWSPEKKKAFNEAVEKAEKASNYKEWHSNYDPKYTKATESKLQEEADAAMEKFNRLK